MGENNLKQWWLASKSRLIYAGTGSLAFVILGVYLILTAEDKADSLNPLIIKSVGIVTIIFFEAIAIFSFKGLIQKDNS